jgi:two-component system alkaline phosphatase synthesis response regulator PhoP
MEKKYILAVDDEENILELVEYNLSREGYKVKKAACGKDVLDIARTDRPDLILLDLMLPDIDGLEVCRLIKSDPKTSSIPIVMLTAKTGEADIVVGLEMGADDYVTKPFSPRVLAARVKAVLRRKAKALGDENSVVKIHELELNPGRHELLLNGKPVDLTYTEFKILHYLARKPGWVFTRYQIVEAVRGEEYAVTDRAVDVQIVSLRKKLGRFGKYLETVRGIGYRFKE